MSELLQFIIVVAFGVLCFGCGYLTAFFVARNRWRDEMIKRGVPRYNWQTGKWEWGEPPKVTREGRRGLGAAVVIESVVSRAYFSFGFFQFPVIAHAS